MFYGVSKREMTCLNMWCWNRQSCLCQHEAWHFFCIVWEERDQDWSKWGRRVFRVFVVVHSVSDQQEIKQSVNNTHFSFWFSIALVKISFCQIVINHTKIPQVSQIIPKCAEQLFNVQQQKEVPSLKKDRENFQLTDSSAVCRMWRYLNLVNGLACREFPAV